MVKIEKIDVVDVIIATDEGVPLILRKYEPYKDCWAIPGGHVDPEDYSITSSVEEAYRKAAIREAEEETHLKIKIIKKIGVYDKPGRDPRGNYVSQAYLARVVGGELRADSDAKKIKFFKEIPDNIAFDHGDILKDSKVFENY